MEELEEKGRWLPRRARAVRSSYSSALGIMAFREGPAAGLMDQQLKGLQSLLFDGQFQSLGSFFTY